MNLEEMLESKLVAAVAIAAVVGLLSWLAVTVQGLDKKVAVIDNKIESLSLEGFSTRVSLMEQRLERVEEWTRRLSDRQARLEQGQGE